MTNNMFIVKEYRITYDLGNKETKAFSLDDFGIAPIEGYTLVGIHKFYSGDANHQICMIDPTSSDDFCRIYNYTTTARSNVTASIWLVWMRSDTISTN